MSPDSGAITHDKPKQLELRPRLRSQLLAASFNIGDRGEAHSIAYTKDISLERVDPHSLRLCLSRRSNEGILGRNSMLLLYAAFPRDLNSIFKVYFLGRHSVIDVPFFLAFPSALTLGT